jgi:CubicO group peptidase (beta-lactamase class C family)
MTANWLHRLTRPARTRRTARRPSVEALEDRCVPSRNPVLLVPGFLASSPNGTTLTFDEWAVNLGSPPTGLTVDGAENAYDAILAALQAEGYVLGQDLFAAVYDWRLPVAPLDDDNDGNLADVTASGITDGSLDYGVDYLGYWLQQAMDAWEANNPSAGPLTQVDIIAHSMGNLLTRAYIESPAYGGSFTAGGETLTLPTVGNYLAVSAPTFGVSEVWNVYNNNVFFVSYGPAVASLVLDPVFDALAGGTIQQVNGPTPITLDSITDPATGEPDGALFLAQYVQSLTDLTPTFDFLEVNGVMGNINDQPGANDLLLDLNGGADPAAFATEVRRVVNVFGTGIDTNTTSVQHTGPAGTPMIYSVSDDPNQPQPHDAADGQVWYEDVLATGDQAGDGTVPLFSLTGEFFDNPYISMRAFPGQDHTSVLSYPQAIGDILDTLAPNPIGSGAFEADLTTLLADTGVPQASVALMYQGQIYTATATNVAYFDQSMQPVADPVLPESLFRLASLAKPFVGAAAVALVEDGLLASLDENPFRLLGYQPGQPIAGNDPMDPTGPQLTANLPSDTTHPLWQITIRNLLQMQSGLPGTVPVQSLTFQPAHGSTELLGNVYGKQGSYASLAFAGGPPYSQPATDPQQLKYFLYQIAADPDLVSEPGQTYVYEDFNFHITGMIVSALSPQGDYGAYLQERILGPMGISPPMAEPVTTNAMIGGSNTQPQDFYPTEVDYYMPIGTDPFTTSIIPDSSKSSAPFYPDALVEVPYGGSNYQHGTALSATPTALVTFLNNLANVYTGQGTGPLTADSVGQMLQAPTNLGGESSSGWFGLGLQVFPNAADPDDLSLASWAKGGDEPGTLTGLKRYPDGSLIAVTLNLDALQEPAGEANKFDPTGIVGDIAALVQQYAFGPAAMTATAGSGQGTTVGTAFATPLQVGVTNALGGPARGVFQNDGSTRPLTVTFTAPSSGAGGTFDGQAAAQVALDDEGFATAPTLTANDTAGSFAVAATMGLLPDPVFFALTNVATDSPGGPSGGGGGATPPPASLTPNEAFVNDAYFALLGRAADPAGMSAWVASLAGGATPAEVAAAICSSQEYRERVVQEIYQEMLGRSADAAGLQFFAAQLAAGGRATDVRIAVASSAEYLARNGGTAAGFVEALYRDALGRSADPSGLAAFTQALAAGASRGDVARAIFGSPEGLAVVVEGYYQEFLGRAADAAGLAGWVAALRAGTSDAAVVAGFLGSQEKLNRD